MNGKWIEIFRGGEQKDSLGRKHDGDKMIDTALSLFNAEEHEPPVVIGHPKNNAPAFGWIQALKKEGHSLFAKFKDTQPEFVDMVERGLFKKRSAAFYPDGSLRHVGFLGAKPPAVKGLADIAFSEEDSLVFEFSDCSPQGQLKDCLPQGQLKDCSPQGQEFHDDFKFRAVSRIISNLRDFIIAKFDLDTANNIANIFDIETISEPTEEKESPLFSQQKESEVVMSGATTFSQADMDRAKQEAAEEARKKTRQEFEEKENDRVSKLEQNLIKQKEDLHKKEIRSFVESGVKDGKILPAWDKAGLTEFMEGLDYETEIEFSDSDGKTVKTNQLDKFKCLLEILPKTVNFEEISNAEEPDLSRNLDSQVKEFAEKKNLSYKDALIEFEKEHPELVESK